MTLRINVEGGEVAIANGTARLVFTLSCEGKMAFRYARDGRVISKTYATHTLKQYWGTWWPTVHAQAVRDGWLFQPGGRILGPCCSGKKASCGTPGASHGSQ